MLFRIIFFIFFIFLLYKLAKFVWGTPKNHANPQTHRNVHDELVKDPVCGVYLPKSQAKPLFLTDKTFYFCSEECRQKFSLEEHGRSS